ncbi:amino acid permease [bacterium]|nr:amino acid permease [bacterium]
MDEAEQNQIASRRPEPDNDAQAGGPRLRRVLGLGSAVILGLGSILGTGVFVSLALAAGSAGPLLPLALVIAAALALLNGLSSAQLATAYPVSGGTYEYGYRLLGEWPGFFAGWLFLCAKTASAATAALGFSAYLLGLFGLQQPLLQHGLALLSVLGLGLLLQRGARLGSALTGALVGATVVALLSFCFAGLAHLLFTGPAPQQTPLAWSGPLDWLARLLQASALMFVAYTGYGRIATLGEEVTQPRRTIPRAIVLSLLAALLLYIAVGSVAVSAVGGERLAAWAAGGTAPLLEAARGFGLPLGPQLIALGALCAMLGVLLNLLLGLSRVALAMARRADLPAGLARLNEQRSAPVAALWLCAVAVGLLAALGGIKAAWSFSALTVLLYYALTNICALRLPRTQRLYHPLSAWLGLCVCLGLSVFIEPRIWLYGAVLLAAGVLWRLGWRALSGARGSGAAS